MMRSYKTTKFSYSSFFSCYCHFVYRVLFVKHYFTTLPALSSPRLWSYYDIKYEISHIKCVQLNIVTVIAVIQSNRKDSTFWQAFPLSWFLWKWHSTKGQWILTWTLQLVSMWASLFELYQKDLSSRFKNKIKKHTNKKKTKNKNMANIVEQRHLEPTAIWTTLTPRVLPKSLKKKITWEEVIPLWL